MLLLRRGSQTATNCIKSPKQADSVVRLGCRFVCRQAAAATALEAFVSASASCVALSSALLLPELFVWMETFSCTQRCGRPQYAQDVQITMDPHLRPHQSQENPVTLEGFDAFSLSFGFAVASTAVAFGAFASTFCFAVASVAFVFSEEEADAAGLEEALTSVAKLPNTPRKCAAVHPRRLGCSSGWFRDGCDSLRAEKRPSRQFWKASHGFLPPVSLSPWLGCCRNFSSGWTPHPGSVHCKS